VHGCTFSGANQRHLTEQDDQPLGLVTRLPFWLNQVQIGCQVDCLDRLKELWRAPCVHKTFRITTPMVQVWNLWGGLLYLVAPPNTQVEGLKVTVERAVLAPYYKSGEFL